MPTAITVTAVEHSGFSSDAPTRSEITNAMRNVVGRTYGSLTRTGNWVGPAPRITRWETLAGAKTYATWVFLVPSDSVSADFQQRLRDDVQAELDAHASHHGILGPDWIVTAAPYNEAVNGAPWWWEATGPISASREARWVDAWPPLDAQIIPGSTRPVEDNHVGPNSLHSAPEESNPLLWVTILAGIGVAGLALVEFGPAISAWARSKSYAAPKQLNPRRR